MECSPCIPCSWGIFSVAEGCTLQVVTVASTFCEVWEGVAATIAEIDVLAGFAELAVSAPLPYVRPNMLPADAGEISLTGCRCASDWQQCDVDQVKGRG